MAPPQKAAEGAAPRLSNDLDFYVVAEYGSSGADLAAIAAALRPVSKKWTARLGVDVDFSPPKPRGASRTTPSA